MDNDERSFRKYSSKTRQSNFSKVFIEDTNDTKAMTKADFGMDIPKDDYIENWNTMPAWSDRLQTMNPNDNKTRLQNKRNNIESRNSENNCLEMEKLKKTASIKLFDQNGHGVRRIVVPKTERKIYNNQDRIIEEPDCEEFLDQENFGSEFDNIVSQKYSQTTSRKKG